MISRSSSSCSVTELAVTTIPRTDSLDQAQRDRLRRRDHAHPFSPRKTEWYQKKNKSAGTLGDITSVRVTRILRGITGSATAGREKEDGTRHNCRKGRLQPNSDARARNWSRGIDAQRQLFSRSWRRNLKISRRVRYLCQLPEEPFAKSQFGWSLRTQNFDYEAIESERYRLQSQESFVSHGARGRGYQHQQKVIEMQRHLGDASS